MEVKQMLQEEELNKLHEQQNQYNSLLAQLGSAEVIIKQIESNLESVKTDKSKLFNLISQLNNQAEEFQKTLIDKYGEGIDVDLKTGEFSVRS
jgi:predicted nuclease with TOPRIM domain